MLRTNTPRPGYRSVFRIQRYKGITVWHTATYAVYNAEEVRLLGGSEAYSWSIGVDKEGNIMLLGLEQLWRITEFELALLQLEEITQ